MWVTSNARSEPDVIDTILTRLWDQLVGRLSNPMAFRFLLQPAVALTLGILAGLRDARAQRPAYLWTVLTDADGRRHLLLDGWRDVSKLFVVATALDTLYQLLVLHFFYPLQALAVAGVLAFVPYVAIRGLVTRMVTRYRNPASR